MTGIHWCAVTALTLWLAAVAALPNPHEACSEQQTLPYVACIVEATK